MFPDSELNIEDLLETLGRWGWIWNFSKNLVPLLLILLEKSMTCAKHVVFFSWQKADQQVFILHYF